MVREIQKRIYRALMDDQLALFRDLIEANLSELNVKAAGLTWLSRAASNGNLDAAKMLIELGAEINPDDEYHPLTFAVSGPSLQVIRFLLEQGADPKHGRCLIRAINRECEGLAVLKLLIEFGADVNKIFDQEGLGYKFTALDWASKKQLTDYLLSVGAKTTEELLGPRHEGSKTE